MTRSTASSLLGQLGRRRDLIRDPRVPDLGLGPNNPLRQGRRRREKRPGNFLGRQTADLAERQGDLRIGRQCRVTARENQAKLVVLDAFIGCPRRVILHGDVGPLTHVLQGIETGLPAHVVDRLETSCGHQPCARIAGHTVTRPLIQRCPEGVLQGFLGFVEVAQEADQSGEYTARVGEVDGINRLVDGIGRWHDPRSDHLHSSQRNSAPASAASHGRTGVGPPFTGWSNEGRGFRQAGGNNVDFGQFHSTSR